MNVLKALAKMTKLAAALQRQVDHSKGEFIALRMNYDDTVRITTERYDLIKSLEAKLYAAEQRGVIPLRCVEAVATIESLHYAWSEQDGKWYSPPVAAVPYPSANWDSHAWATHYLHNASLVAPAYVHAELVGGTFYGDPDDNKHGRICYHVGLKSTDWKVLETRPGYIGPLTCSPAPIPVDVPAAMPLPNKPRGLGWRNNSIAAAPRDMSEQIEAVLLNGVRKTRPASEFEWSTQLSTGVAWWRFVRPDRGDVEPAK